LKVSTYQKGLVGEQRAVQILEQQGYRIVARNFRIRSAELDVIAIDKGSLCFVEIKTWNTLDSFDLSRVIGKVKQQRMIRAAMTWIMKNGYEDCTALRFDVLLLRPEPAVPALYKSAFDASSKASGKYHGF